MLMTKTGLRIQTLRNVAEWNEERAAATKNEDDKMRLIHNATECREEIMDIIHMDAARDL